MTALAALVASAALVVTAPTLVGCATDQSAEPGPSGGPSDSSRSPSDKPSDASSDSELIPPTSRSDEALGGLPLERHTDGPWTVRAPPREAPREGGGSGSHDEAGLLAAEAEAYAAEAPEGAASGGGGAGYGRAARGDPGELEAAPPPAPAGDGDGDVGLDEVAGARRIRPAPQSAGPLKAGTTDDNADLEGFLRFLATWTERPDLDGRVSTLDVSDRRFLRVVDRRGAPLPGAEVRILDERTEAVKFIGTTYGDGVVPFFPKVSGVVASGVAPAPVIVEARYQGRQVNQRWDLRAERFEISVDAAHQGPVPLDAVFLIDTTGSMGDEIAQIKATLLKVTERLRTEVAADVDLRYGAVLYRDLGDEYVTRTHPFTRDIAAFDEALREIGAGGGGDFAESLNQGLAEAVGGVAWRRTAAKVVFLIADAPPHTDYENDVPYGESLKDALARGVRVHAVAASGLDPFGSLVFRQTAQYTRGRFIFIEYGSPASSGEKHGVAGPQKSNNLDDILFDQLRAEIEGYGKGDSA